MTKQFFNFLKIKKKFRQTLSREILENVNAK